MSSTDKFRFLFMFPAYCIKMDRIRHSKVSPHSLIIRMGANNCVVDDKETSKVGTYFFQIVNPTNIGFRGFAGVILPLNILVVFL